MNNGENYNSNGNLGFGNTAMPNTGMTNNPGVPNMGTPNASVPNMGVPIQNQFNSMQNMPIINNQSNVQKNNNKKIILIGIISTIAIITIVLITFVLKKKPASQKAPSITDSDAFFLFAYDKSKYLLFDIDGKRLSDDEFASVEKFVKGTTVVRKDEGEYGIISDKGKMIVDFGVYKYIYQYGPFYLATDKDFKNYFLDSNGNVLKEGKLKAYDTECDEAVILNDYTNFSVYNSDGKIIATIPYDSSAKELDDITDISGSGHYFTMYYNNKTYVVNANSKLITTLDQKIRIGVSGDDVVVLSPYTDDYTNNTSYIIINDKVAYKSNSGYLELKDDNVLIDNHLLDDKGNVISENMVSFIDNKNYAINKGENNIEITENGKVKATVKCQSYSSQSYAKEGIYVFRNCDGKSGYTYYTKDGKPINKEPYFSAEAFDSEGIAIVTNDKRRYFLIDKKGNVVSDEYKKIYSAAVGIYVATKDDDKVVVLNAKNEELINATNFKEHYYGHIIYFDENSKANVYDVKTGKSVGPYDETPYMREQYFEITKNGKKQYYSYTTGKMLYEES